MKLLWENWIIKLKTFKFANSGIDGMSIIGHINSF